MHRNFVTRFASGSSSSFSRQQLWTKRSFWTRPSTLTALTAGLVGSSAYYYQYHYRPNTKLGKRRVEDSTDADDPNETYRPSPALPESPYLQIIQGVSQNLPIEDLVDPYYPDADGLKNYDHLYEFAGSINGNTGIERFDTVSLPNKAYREESVSWESTHFDFAFADDIPGIPSENDWTFFSIYDGFDGWEASLFLYYNLIRTVMDDIYSAFDGYYGIQKQRLALEAEDWERAVEREEYLILNLDEQPKDEDIPAEPLRQSPPSLITSPDPDPMAYTASIDSAIKSAFLDVDDVMVQKSYEAIISPPYKSFTKEQRAKEKHRASAMLPLSTALAGSSVLMGFYDRKRRELKVALTGDSRAVLGRRGRAVDGDGGGKHWEVHVLTADQIDSSLYASHNRLRNRVHHVSRAFGRAALKWSVEMQERVHREYLGDRPISIPSPSASSTSDSSPAGVPQGPPYITAEPTITTINIEPGDFVVMASCGLWKSLTNEEAVGLVGLWLDRGMKNNLEAGVRGGPATSHIPVVTSPSSSESEVGGGGEASGTAVPSTSANRGPEEIVITSITTDSALPEPEIIERNALPVVNLGEDRTTAYSKWRTSKRFLCVDDNVASHLARNALGGADRDLMAALLRWPPAMWGRRHWDTISATVVFFE